MLGSSSKPGAWLLSSLSCSTAVWTAVQSQARGSTKDSAVFLGLSFKTQKLISQHDKAPISLKDLAPFNPQFTKPNFPFSLFFSFCFYQQFPLWIETMNEPTRGQQGSEGFGGRNVMRVTFLFKYHIGHAT